MQGAAFEFARATFNITRPVMMDLTFNASMKQMLTTNLNNLDRRPIVDSKKKHAAVAIVVTNCARAASIAQIKFDPGARDQAAFILTIRSSRLSNHSGQRAFPGGRVDQGESVEQAALRELEEEVNLKLGNDSIVGYLDDYVTRSGFVITPVILWAGVDIQCTANPQEVESIHLVPMTELLRKEAPILESIPESENPVLKMPLGDEWIAAPTAAIAYQFREVALLGKLTRVAHFEQPYFAWR